MATSTPCWCNRSSKRFPASAACCVPSSKDASLLFEVQSQKGQLVRGDLARAVVASGWDLNELRPAAKSLEEIFLQLTGSEAPAEAEKNPAIEQQS